MTDLTVVSPPPRQEVISHFKGQLFFSCANLLIKRASKDEGSWRDTSKLAGLLYLGAFGCDILPQWSGVGSMRKVVSGHMLHSIAGGDRQWSDRILSLGSNVGERVFKAVFIVRDQRDKQSQSWVSGQSCVTSTTSLPSMAEISVHCPGYVSLYTGDLHMLLWLILRHYSPGRVFDLAFPLPGAGMNTQRENVTSVDLASFLYGLAYCVGWEGEREDAPILSLPPSLSPVVTSTVQETWWSVAARVLDDTLRPSDRRTLQHGVEALRCTGLHGLDVNLTMKLGKTFERLSLESGSVTDGDQAAAAIVTSLEARASLYYTASLASIERIERGAALKEPSVRLLQPAGNTPSMAEMDKMREAANYFLASQKMHQGCNGEALEAFKEIKTPYAAFYSGEIFKKMAIEEKTSGGIHDNGDHVRELLVESREAFYLTLDRIRGLGGASHPLDAQLAEHMEDVENMLKNEENLVNEGEETSVTPTLDTPKKYDLASRRLMSQLTSTPQGHRSLFDGNVSGGRSEARPSPERLDAQMRHLTGELSRTTSQLAKTVSQVGDTSEFSKVVSATKDVLECNTKILGELKDGLLPAVRNIHDEIRELRRDFAMRDDRYLEVLRKISDNTATSASAASKPPPAPAPVPAPAPAAPALSSEERLLLESFGLSASSSLHPFLQQQMIQQQLARQTPNMMGMAAASMGLNMYNPAAPQVFNPMVSLPNSPLPPQPARMSSVAAPVPQLSAMTQPQVMAAQKPVQSQATPNSKAAPGNVVISVSDPIPQTAPVITAPMTVTVPPQHRLGGLSNSPRAVTTGPSAPSTPQTGGVTPHGYQIQMPDGVSPLTVSPFKSADDSSVTITTQSLLSSIPNPVISAVTPSPEKPASMFAAKTRAASGSATKQVANTDTGEGEEPEHYEPEVEFAPVIPLPEMVEVVTGEEDEEIVFEERAKLFRFSDDTKEWKERGLGQAKILKDKASGKYRFLMRWEVTLKVCANHQILPNMKVDKMTSNVKARIWGAQDFADEELKTEKFCIRFKTEEIADNFDKKFTEAASQANASPMKPTKENKTKEITEANKEASVKVETIGANGGFSFGSSASSSGFSFNKTNGSATMVTPTDLSTKSTTASNPGFGFGSPAANKPSVGGFSFSTTPVVVKNAEVVKKEEKKEPEAAKPSPFAAFSFGGKTPETSLAFGSKTEVIQDDKVKTTSSVFGDTSAAPSFGSLAGGEGFKKDENFSGFAGAGSSVFGGQKKEADNDEGGADEEYEPDVHFKPVIPLPELVEVKTGEEDEEVMFTNRAKLFRFVAETKEWKERGIGDFKILKNKQTGKVRFLMRREQVLKICCNHFLSQEMDFKPLSSSDKAWQWSAPDFSEGEVTNELFALRFKTADLANDWKKIVDDCKANLTVSPVKASGSKLEDKVTEVKPKPTTLAQFAAAQKAGSWECQFCLTRNDNSRIQCMACEAPKPGCEEEVKKLQAEKEAAKPPAPVMTMGEGGGFKFGSGPSAGGSGGGFSFGGGQASSSDKTAASGAATGGFSFGSKVAEVSASSASGGFSFGAAKTDAKDAGSGFSFSSPAPKASNGDADSAKSPFGASSGHQFSFSGVKTSPQKPGAAGTSPRKHNDSTTSENEYYQDDEADNLYFEPIIPLPDKVDVKTGEEEEAALYSHRAKLFRYTDGEWKERGVGDIKILKHSGTGKVRLLMRREQVLKICLNHFITQSLVAQFKEKDTKSWTWAAQDFSEGELESMTFALRFKTPEISAEFKKALDDAAKDAKASPAKADKSSSKKSPETEQAKPAPKSVANKNEDEGLFKPEDFKPLERLGQEVELSFDGQGLKLNSEDDAADVCKKIVSHGDMHTLTFSGNTIGIEAAGAIGKALEKHPELRRAHWKDMFTGRMKTEIPPALVNMTRGIMVAQARLTELDLSDNAFGPVGMEGLVTFLKSPSCFSLQELKLNNTGCGVTGGKMLANLLLECYERSKAVGHPLALKVFILGRSRQENEGATALAKVFKLMGSLEEVVMPQNGIYYEGLTALADAFSNNPNLKILNMNDNTFTAKGAKAMASALRKLNNLEILNLGDCLMKSGGTKLICKALTGRHPNLRELVLDSNEIRLKGGLEIVKAIQDKEKLEKLSIDANQFGESGLKQILKKISDIGKEDIVGDTEDNEEPDSDEEDPDVSDDEVDEAAKSKADSTDSKTASSIFGGSSASKPGASIFGGAPSSSSIFGGAASNTTPFKAAGNLFSASPSQGTPVFGTPTSSSSIFGGASNTSTESETPKSSGIFTKLSTPGPSVFGGASAVSSTTSVFGGAGQPQSEGGLFGKKTEEKKPEPDSSSGSIFGSAKSTGAFDFKTLASSATGFNTAGEDFKFAGAGSSLFSAKKTAGDGDEEAENDDDEAADDGHDPHFEPIVPLPELVEVKTGEEDEEELFKHRAKVYRYCSDTKQWKERGVGDIKILKNPRSGITRVLLRRDQVHKIAANHRISKEMELKPLSGSETAWCWYAMDFSEGHEDTGSLEHLAVRFKTKDTAENFKAKFEECQNNIGQAVATGETATEDGEGGDEDYEDYEDEEEYDENSETIMFHNTATMHIKGDSGNFISQVCFSRLI